MNSLMIKSLIFSAVLVVATIAVVMSLDIDIFADSVNALTMAGAVVIAVATSAVSVKYVNQMKTDTASGTLVDENWDGIGEYTNELPSGWAYTFLGTIIYFLWYMFIGFPVNAFSQIGQYNEEVLAYNKKFESKHQNANKETLKNMGKSIFFVQCAPCHGNEGDGLDGKAQDFSARMSKEQILDVIKNGSNKNLGYSAGMMPGGMASGAGAEEVATYIATGMKGEAPASYTACAGCHGQDGKGMNGMAPNLKTYDTMLVNNVLMNGKKGILGTMPSFKTMITPIQEKALSEYIQSISAE